MEKSSTEIFSLADFSEIVFQSPQMHVAIEQAQMMAPHTVPVLIEGESGIGKELFARAIHRASLRREKTFVAVNCGAIPSELIDSELFGHKKGAFTGATSDKKGIFRSAESGTIFLDEIGELPLSAQVRLLRVLQEKEITPVGAGQSKNIDVRVVSATNRNLSEEVFKGNFREDLFYRLAVFQLYLPPLRERTGDLTLLINYFLNKLNEENAGKFWKEAKKLSPAAKNVLINHRWTGNIRELQHTILRAMVLTKESTITETDIKRSLFVVKKKEAEDIFNRPMADGFSLPNLISEVARHYLVRALEESNQNKTKAAKLVDLPNYQTFDNWLERHQS